MQGTLHNIHVGMVSITHPLLLMGETRTLVSQVLWYGASVCTLLGYTGYWRAYLTHGYPSLTGEACAAPELLYSVCAAVATVCENAHVLPDANICVLMCLCMCVLMCGHCVCVPHVQCSLKWTCTEQCVGRQRVCHCWPLRAVGSWLWASH